MAKIMSGIRVIVAGISLLAVLSTPFVVMTSKAQDDSVGYGIDAAQFDGTKLNAETSKLNV